MPRLICLLLLATSLLACSGNAVIEPAELTNKRAKLFLDKCQVPDPQDGTQVTKVYACISLEEGCPDPGSPEAKTELGYVLDKGDHCGNGTIVYDVPCGPDLNAIDCCYVARVQKTAGGCE